MCVLGSCIAIAFAWTWKQRTKQLVWKMYPRLKIIFIYLRSRFEICNDIFSFWNINLIVKSSIPLCGDEYLSSYFIFEVVISVRNLVCRLLFSSWISSETMKIGVQRVGVVVSQSSLLSEILPLQFFVLYMCLSQDLGRRIICKRFTAFGVASFGVWA